MMYNQPKQIISFAEFELDPARRRLVRDGKTLSLNAKAFDLLVYLVENPGRIVTKDEILDAVWENQFVEEANLKVQISTLRKVLGEQMDDPRFLVTIPGKGYKFIAEVNNVDHEIIIESHRFSRLVIEQEEALEMVDDRKFISFSQKIGIAALALLVAVAFGAFQYFNLKKAKIPFEKIKFTRLTNNGKVSGVTLSLDGKYIATVLGEIEGNSIWVQQVETANNLMIVPPTKAQIWELKFSPDGKHIYYNLFSEQNTTPELFRISTLGGVSEKIPNVIASFIAFSPDGKRMAYAQSNSAAGQNYLITADVDGTNQQTIAKKNYPNTFETNVPVVAWSPDGETIACLVNYMEAEASYSSIIGINLKDGSEKPLSHQRWYNVFSLEWLKDGSGLLISASDKVSGNNQIQFLSYPNGEARQITNDLSRYGSLSGPADDKSFVIIQTSKSSSIFVSEAGTDNFKEIVFETGELHPFVWTPDGKIIFRSNKDGVSNLWTIDTDGGHRRQLTTNAQIDSRGLCISPDGKYLVFGSWRNGKSNLWRVNADGGNLTQLTNGEADVYPDCSPDDQSVVYQRGLNTKPMLWKINLEGGEPVQLTDFYSKWNAISNDGRQVSFLQMVDSVWRIGIISSSGGGILQRLDAPSNLDRNLVRWSPDNQSLFYISTVGNVGNIGLLPLDGSEPKLITNFKSHLLEDFSWSPDGTKLAVVRDSSLSDVVLITNETLP